VSLHGISIQPSFILKLYSANDVTVEAVAERMSLLDYVNALGDWVLANLDKIVFSAVTIAVVYVFYRIIVREIRALRARERLEEHLAFTLIRITKWASALVILSAVLAQWGVEVGVISGILTIFGGTIIGFAAINTIGNAIAGLIVMTSRPFKVGDRIFFNGQFADITSIELIYTKMLTLDNVLVSVPNQELLKAEIDNYGRKNVVRRMCTVTPSFEYDSADIEKTLLEAASDVEGVLKEPRPYVWITKFQNYAVEYTLYVFINDIRRLPETDAALHRKVFETCKKHGIDISTPLLLKQLRS
jgi:small-conductance mechanosensitive channel